MYLQDRLLFTGLDAISKKLYQGDFLSSEEKLIYNNFVQARGAGTAIFSGSKELVMEQVYQMMVGHGIVESNKDLYKVITGKGMTLGSVLHSEYYKKNIRSEYYKILEYLFDTKQMNIRNCIMHGNSVTYDYLAIGITSVMLQLLWDIGRYDIFETNLNISE